MSRPLQMHTAKHSSSGHGQGRERDDRIIHDEELGEENVELVDSEWADFERALRYSTLVFFFYIYRINEWE